MSVCWNPLKCLSRKLLTLIIIIIIVIIIIVSADLLTVDKTFSHNVEKKGN